MERVRKGKEKKDTCMGLLVPRYLYSVGRAMFMFMLCYVMGQHAMHQEVVHSWREVM